MPIIRCLAAAAVLAITTAAAGAADPSDLCCLDLEERVAELEATAVRKGKRVVSLQVYGQISRALLIWDDGVDSDAYVVDNDFSTSRFGLQGTGHITANWLAGFVIEIGVDDADSASVNNGGFLALDGDGRYAPDVDSNSFDEGNGESHVDIRHVKWYVQNTALGRLTVGHSNPASKDIVTITLADIGAFTSVEPDILGHFVLRGRSDLAANNRYLSNLTWGDMTAVATSTAAVDGGLAATPLNSQRGDFIRYDSPSFDGFILSTAWGENDIWDVALRFSRSWNSIHFSTGIAYYDDQENDARDIKGSAALMDQASGLFINVSALHRRSDDINSYVGDHDGHLWYLTGGIQRRWLPWGDTVFYGEYGEYRDFAVGAIIHERGSADDAAVMRRSQAQRWGLGLAQNFDSASFQLYASGQYWQGSGSFDPLPLGEGEDEDRDFRAALDDWWGVLIGGIIHF